MSEKTCVIVGASHAGSQASLSIRQAGWAGPIILIGDERELPYHRPPLSKAYLSGEKTFEQILLKPASAYEKAGVELRLGERVGAIDRERKVVTLEGGEEIGYDKLVLATGARVRKLPVPGADDPRVLYLRNAEDVLTIRASLGSAARAVVIGGGYIGLEVAASLRKHGLEVTVLEAMDRILQRVTSPVMSDFFRRLHTEEGVIVREGVGAERIVPQADGLVVATSDGGTYPADFVVVGIGVVPNTELAGAAGLAVGNGIKVGPFGQTSDPDIHAAGDCTWHHCPFYDCSVRLESVPNATEQAKTIAKYLAGTEEPYCSLPWFWSDQFDVKLQIAGLSEGHDRLVVRGDPEKGRSFAVFYYRGEQLLAVDAVNAPVEYMTVRMALTKGQTLDPAKVADPSTDIRAAVAG